MRKFLSVLLLMLFVGGFGLAVRGQEETPEGTPTVEATEEATDEATPEASPEVTAEGTTEATATVEPTAGPTSAATATPQTTPEVTPEATEILIPLDRQAHYRIAQFAPDLSGVEVEVNGESSDLDALDFPDVSKWQTVETGTYQFAFVPGDESDSTASTGSFDVSLEAGTWSTIALIGSAENGTLVAHEIEEDYGELLPGTGGLTIFDAIEGDLTVNVNRSGVPYVTELTFPDAVIGGSSELSLQDDAGSFDFQAVETQNPSNVIADLPQTDIQENAYTFIAVVGTEDDPQGVVDVTDRAEVNIELGDLEAPGTIIEAAEADENLTTFAEAVEAAGLTETLSGEGPYTVFAPANFVLDNVDMSDPDALAELLLHHVIEGKVLSRGVTSAQTLETLAGDTVTVRIEGNNIFIDDAQIIALNIPATNGVIHMINGVLTTDDEE